MPVEIRIIEEPRSGSEGWSVYEGQEWFAHATSRTDALRYASDLLHEGQGPRGSVWLQMGVMEHLRDGYDPDTCPKCGCHEASGLTCPMPPCGLRDSR